jgi:hypothetical protein
LVFEEKENQQQLRKEDFEFRVTDVTKL